MSSPSNTVLVFAFVESAVLTIVNISALNALKAKRRFLSSCRFKDVLLQILFATHMISGMMNLVLHILLLVGVPYKEILYLVFSRDCIGASTVLLTVLLSLDRFLAIRKPFLYQRLGKPHAVVTLCIAYCVLVGFCVSLKFTRTVFYFGSTFIVLGGSYILVSNIFLYQSVKRQCEEISRTIVDPSLERQTQKRNDMRERKLKSLRICIYITASYLLTWFPLAVYLVFDLTPQINDNTLFVIFQIVGFSNGIWDVLIYFFMNRASRIGVSQQPSERTNANESSL